VPAELLLLPISDSANDDSIRMIRRTSRGGNAEERARHAKRRAWPELANIKQELPAVQLCGAGGQSDMRRQRPVALAGGDQATAYLHPFCRTARSAGGGLLSISVRMACRSSVAEITGNSSTSTQPSASRHCNALTLAQCPRPRALSPQPVRRQRHQHHAKIKQQFHTGITTPQM